MVRPHSSTCEVGEPWPPYIVNTNLYDVLCSLKNDLDEFQVKVMVAHNLKFVYKVLMSECYRYIHYELYNSQNVLIRYLMHQVACLAKSCTMEMCRDLNGKCSDIEHNALQDVITCFTELLQI